MIILGYLLAVTMGLILGLLGAGGSILTLPILVYLLRVQPIVATGYSLLVVGSAALMGAVGYWRQGQVRIGVAMAFAIPSILAVLSMRMILLPSLPDVILGFGKDHLIMLFFGILMVLASMFMLKPTPSPLKTRVRRSQGLQYTGMFLGSIGVGLLTGLVGAGGGFLIIPVLVALFNLPMKEAIGTSLAIIAMNALMGFRGDLAAGMEMDWPLLALFLSLTFVGMGLGIIMGRHISGERLRRMFGVMTLILGVLVITLN